MTASLKKRYKPDCSSSSILSHLFIHSWRTSLAPSIYPNTIQGSRLWFHHRAALIGFLRRFWLRGSYHSSQNPTRTIRYYRLSDSMDCLVPFLKISQCKIWWTLIKNFQGPLRCTPRIHPRSTSLHSLHLQYCQHCLAPWSYDPSICWRHPTLRKAIWKKHWKHQNQNRSMHPWYWILVCFHAFETKYYENRTHLVRPSEQSGWW